MAHAADDLAQRPAPPRCVALVDHADLSAAAAGDPQEPRSGTPRTVGRGPRRRKAAGRCRSCASGGASRRSKARRNHTTTLPASRSVLLHNPAHHVAPPRIGSSGEELTALLLPPPCWPEPPSAFPPRVQAWLKSHSTCGRVMFTGSLNGSSVLYSALIIFAVVIPILAGIVRACLLVWSRSA